MLQDFLGGVCCLYTISVFTTSVTQSSAPPAKPSLLLFFLISLLIHSYSWKEGLENFY